MKVHVIGGEYSYVKMYKERGIEHVPIGEADFVQFTGGADVYPALYSQHTHRSTYCSPERDHREILIYSHCIERNLKMVGICRGAQFLNVMNNGEMFQDVEGHATMQGHDVLDIETNAIIPCTSTHHQMMSPNLDTGILVAKAASVLSPVKKSMTDLPELPQEVLEKYPDDVEVVYYKDTNCLCFQPHPEIVRKEHPCQKYFFSLLERYLNVKI